MARKPTTSIPLVGIIMGSSSDLTVMQAAADILTELGVAHEISVVSAHRTPQRMFEYAKDAADRGIRVIIAGAGGAARRCRPRLEGRRSGDACRAASGRVFRSSIASNINRRRRQFRRSSAS